jgi:hypothetical protein
MSLQHSTEQREAQGEVSDLPPFGITILSFSDPDGIQVELTMPLE